MLKTGYDELFVFDKKDIYGCFQIINLLVEAKANQLWRADYAFILCEKGFSQPDLNEPDQTILTSTNGHILANYKVTGFQYDMPSGAYDIIKRSKTEIVLGHIRDGKELVDRYPKYQLIMNQIKECTFSDEVRHSMTFEIDLLRAFPETTMLDLDYVSMIKRTGSSWIVHWKNRESAIYFKANNLTVCLMPRNDGHEYHQAFKDQMEGIPE